MTYKHCPGVLQYPFAALQPLEQIANISIIIINNN